MSDVLHHASLTPSQCNASSRRANFRADIEAKAQARKPKPLVIQINEPQEVKSFSSHTTDALDAIAVRIAAVRAELVALDSEIHAVEDNHEIVTQECSDTRGPNVHKIQNFVASQFGITRRDLISDRRDAKIIMPRHIAIYLCRQLTLRSLVFIGRRFNKRDHTTILSAARKIERLRGTDLELDAKLTAFTTALSPQ